MCLRALKDHMAKRRVGQWLYLGLMTTAVWCGCAVPVDPRLNATGTRVVDGREERFASSKELLVAGLIDDGLGLAMKNRFFEAESRLRQAQYLEPDNTRILFNLAVVLNQVAQSEEAEKILKELLRKQPKNIDAQMALAAVKASLGAPSDGIAALKEAFGDLKRAKNAPRSSLVARSIAHLAFQAGNVPEALCYSYEAFRLNPTLGQLGLHGRMLVAQGLYRTAKEFIEAEIKAAPALGKSTMVKHALGVSRFALGDTEGALEVQTQALDFLRKEPELGGEVNAAWYAMRAPTITGDESEAETKVLEDLKVAASEYREASVDVSLVLAPAVLRELYKLPSNDE